MQFFIKRAKNIKKGQNIWAFGQKCTKFETVLKKSSWLHAITACKNVQNVKMLWKRAGDCMRLQHAINC